MFIHIEVVCFSFYQVLISPLRQVVDDIFTRHNILDLSGEGLFLIATQDCF